MKVKIEIELEYDDKKVPKHDSEIERMLEMNFTVAEGIFDLGVDVAPKDIDLHIEVMEDE